MNIKTRNRNVLVSNSVSGTDLITISSDIVVDVLFSEDL